MEKPPERASQPPGIVLCGTTYYSPEEVAEMFGWSKSTLDNWRAQGEGPRYCKRGNKVLYPDHALSDWLEESLGLPQERLDAKIRAAKGKRSQGGTIGRFQRPGQPISLREPRGAKD